MTNASEHTRDVFFPERFRDRNIGLFELVPQGGGDHHLDHFCVGARIAIRLMGAALKVLVREFDYDVLPQDLALDMAQLPALPSDRFAFGRIRPHQTEQESC